MTEDTKFEITTRPIEGAKYQDSAAPEQLGAQEFLDLVDALLAVDGVEAIRWNQYTPFFNDGDACEFSVNDARVKLSARFGAEDEDGDYEDGFLEDYSLYTYDDSLLDGPEPPRDGSGDWYVKYQEWRNKSKVYTYNGQDTRAIVEALSAFNSKTAHIEFVAKSNFGDHAEVTATSAGFEVEEYEHD